VKMQPYGYIFTIVVEKAEIGYVAYAPGVGGVYEEGETSNEAKRNAYEAACAILDTRLEHNAPITKDNEYLKVMTVPPSRQSIVRIKKMPDGYIATPRRLTPVA